MRAKQSYLPASPLRIKSIHHNDIMVYHYYITSLNPLTGSRDRITPPLTQRVAIARLRRARAGKEWPDAQTLMIEREDDRDQLMLDL